MAGRVSGTVSLTGVPGVSARRHAGARAQHHRRRRSIETVSVGAGTVSVNLPAGGVDGYLRVAGTGVQITVAGQTLAGDIVVVKAGSILTLTVANGVINLGSGSGRS